MVNRLGCTRNSSMRKNRLITFIYILTNIIEENILREREGKPEDLSTIISEMAHFMNYMSVVWELEFVSLINSSLIYSTLRIWCTSFGNS